MRSCLAWPSEMDAILVTLDRRIKALAGEAYAANLLTLA